MDLSPGKMIQAFLGAEEASGAQSFDCLGFRFRIIDIQRPYFAYAVREGGVEQQRLSLGGIEIQASLAARAFQRFQASVDILGIDAYDRILRALFRIEQLVIRIRFELGVVFLERQFEGLPGIAARERSARGIGDHEQVFPVRREDRILFRGSGMGEIQKLPVGEGIQENIGFETVHRIESQPLVIPGEGDVVLRE